MNRFLKAWITGYFDPRKTVELLGQVPAPFRGFIAVLIRGLWDSLLLYLPLAMLFMRAPV